MAFGLDIGSHSIKAVQLSQQGNGFSLIAAGITSTPARGLESENQQDLQAVAEAIKKLLQDTKTQEKKVNISISESEVFTRMVSFPPLTDEEVASAISWQAEPYIPIPVSEASLDYQILRRRQAQGPTNPGGVDVLLVAAPKNLIKKYIDVCSMASLTVASVETELLALVRSIAPQKGTVLMLDLGARSSDIAIVENGQIFLSRSISTAGNALTRAVTTGFSIETQQAEEYKKAYGLDSKQQEGKVRQTLEPAFRIIIDEIKKAIQYYKNDLKGGGEVSSVVLSGGTAGMPEIVSYLAETLGFEITIGNPFAKVVNSERIGKSFSAYSPLYGIAVGLAMNE